MKRRLIRLVALVAVVVLGSFLIAGSALTAPHPVTPPQVDWNQLLTYDQMTTMLQQLHADYPRITKMYSIGRTWFERDIWALELSAPITTTAKKTGVAMLANIHGGEQQSGMSAAYTAWWLASQYGKDATATKVLKNYVVYIVPVINPDGYEQSFTYSTRQNMRPTDRNGIAGPFSDPYTDTNGDGMIAQIYQQTTGTPPTPGTIVTGSAAPAGVTKLNGITQYESPDWDHNGVYGDDPLGSTVDMNRNFDYMWNLNLVATNPPLGYDGWAVSGPNAASEPEVQAVQNFLIAHRVNAAVSLHTGEQSVLWPWCYSNAPTKDNDFMKAVSEKMAATWSADTGRGSYTMQSWADFPSTGTVIDWAWGRLGIHAYTWEIYAKGVGQNKWGDEEPQTQWLYIGNWQGNQNTWFMNSSAQQMVGKAPPEQDKMLLGTKDAFIQMTLMEPYGSGFQVPSKVTLKLSGLTSGAMRLGRRVTAKGKVTPTSLAGSQVKLTVQKKRGARWLTVKSVARTISATGAYIWKYKPARRGAYHMRATIAKTAAHTAATTTWRSFKVK